MNPSQDKRGYHREVSKSVRPAKRALPADLADSRMHTFSTGTEHTRDASAKKPASSPNLKSVPRGYAHNEAAFQPSTRDTTGGRLTRRKV